jgi:hypothetical protein
MADAGLRPAIAARLMSRATMAAVPGVRIALAAATLRSLLESDLRKPGFFLELAVCERAKEQKDGPE